MTSAESVGLRPRLDSATKSGSRHRTILLNMGAFRLATFAGVLVVGATACSSTDSAAPAGVGSQPLPESDENPPVCADVDLLREQEAWDETENRDGTTSRRLDATSGRIRAGNFYELFGQGTPDTPGFEAKIYWVPDDTDYAKTNALELVVENLSEPDPYSETITVGGDGNWAASGDQAFWVISVPFPQPGRWRLSAQTSEHRGCFEMTIVE